MNKKNSRKKRVVFMILAGLLLTGLSGLQLSAKAAKSAEISDRGGAGGKLDTLGRYCPDQPASWELEPDDFDKEIEKISRKEIDAVSKEDLRLIEELKDDYRNQTVKQFRLDLAERLEKSDTLYKSISDISYAALYVPAIEMDDFYVSLYFGLTEYSREYQPQFVDMLSYGFMYNRYFGKTYGDRRLTELEYDYDKLCLLGYDLIIDDMNDEEITVGERDDLIYNIIHAFNEKIDEFTYEQWNQKEFGAHIHAAAKEILEAYNDERVEVQLQNINYFDSQLGEN